MSDDECIHGLGPIEACVICNGRAAKEAKEAEDVPTVFEAKYESECPVCLSLIMAGDMVAWRKGRQATHEECWE